jgi:hypothetical protein
MITRAIIGLKEVQYLISPECRQEQDSMMALDMHARAIQKLSTSDRFNLQKKDAVQRKSSRLTFYHIVSFLLGALVSTAVLVAQEAPKNTTSESGIVMRQTVRRVRVDVVVTDAHGDTIRDLHASDFHVVEDGKPQTIRQFEYHGSGDAEAALPKRPALPPHTFMNLPAAPERGPLMVVLYDVLKYSGGRPALCACADAEVPPEERRAVHRHLFPRRPASPSAGLHLGYRTARAGGESNRRFIVEGVSC